MNPPTQFKKTRILPLLIAPALIAIAVAFTSPTVGQTRTPVMFNGIIDDFSPVLDANGPWQVSGQWSLMLIGDSGRGNFLVGLNMLRAENPANRSAHTHQVTLTDGRSPR